MSGALPTTLENPVERFIRTPGRTNNRIRSPRLAASGQYNKVGKGSRQNRSETSGKGLALRVGLGGPLVESLAELELLDAQAKSGSMHGLSRNLGNGLCPFS